MTSSATNTRACCITDSSAQGGIDMLGKALVCSPPELSEPSLMLPLKQFQYRMNVNETKLIWMT